jgi:hypothetical protein
LIHLVCNGNKEEKKLIYFIVSINLSFFLFNCEGIIFGKHKLGHLLPILMTVRESPPDDGPPSFIMLMRKVRSEDRHIVLNQDFSIAGACENSLSLLGVNSDVFSGSACSIRDFIEEWDVAFAEVQKMMSSSSSIYNGTQYATLLVKSQWNKNESNEMSLKNAIESDELENTQSEPFRQNVPLLAKKDDCVSTRINHEIDESSSANGSIDLAENQDSNHVSYDQDGHSAIWIRM